MPRSSSLTLFGLVLLPSTAEAQRADSMSPAVRDVVAADAPVIVLTHVKLIDGTGRPARDDQSVLIENGRITAVGKASEVKAPAGAKVMDLSGHTVIPGIIGLHDHLYYTAAGGRSAQLTSTAPRLYLGAGVTTVRTTGSRAPYAEINLKAEVEKGRVPGPRIHVTAPYITGGEGMTTMTLLETPEQATRFVAYWAKEGATWLKAYTDIRRAELKAAIDEAHRQGIKVTGHLCSVSFTEAVDLGIDGLEHGLFTNSDYVPDKKPDVCPTGLVAAGAAMKPPDPAVQRTFKAMIDKHVPMTSTLAVYELFVPNRPTRDPRALEAMAPEGREDYLRARPQLDSSGAPRAPPAGRQRGAAPLPPRRIKERQGVRAGVRRRGRPARRGGGPDRQRRRAARLRGPAGFRVAERGGIHARAGGADHVAERRQDPRRRQGPGHGGEGEAGRPGRRII